MIISILPVRKLRHRKEKCLALVLTAGYWQSWGLKSPMWVPPCSIYSQSRSWAPLGITDTQLSFLSHWVTWQGRELLIHWGKNICWGPEELPGMKAVSRDSRRQAESGCFAIITTTTTQPPPHSNNICVANRELLWRSGTLYFSLFFLSPQVQQVINHILQIITESQLAHERPSKILPVPPYPISIPSPPLHRHPL